MNKTIKFLIILISLIIPSNVLFAKGYEYVQGTIIHPYSILSNLLITDTGGLLFTGVRGNSSFDATVSVIYGTDSIDSGNFEQKFGSKGSIDSSATKYYAQNSIKLNDGKYVLCEYGNMTLYAMVLNSDFTVNKTIRSYPRGKTDGFVVNCKNSNDWLLVSGSTTSSIVVERYDINGTYIGHNYVSVSSEVKDAISINKTETILIATDQLIKLANSNTTTQALPADCTFTHAIDMQDGTYVAVGYDANKDVILVGFDQDLRILTQKTLTDISSRYIYSSDLKAFSCFKSANRFILLGYINKEAYILELDKNFNILSQDNIYIPYVDMGKLSPICQGITIYKKKVILNFILWDGWNARPYAAYSIYKPVPPTVSISVEYPRIGDNTPVTINVAASEEYPALKISNIETNQNIYAGGATNRYSFYWNRIGNYNFKATIHDTDGELLSTSNTVTVNQTNTLSKILDVIDSKSNLQQMVIIDDTDRYYENNVVNQGIVSQIKQRVDGIFLISNDVSPVLSPLLE